jgi:hypothetical protein
MRDRPDIVKRLDKLQEVHLLKASTVIKCALDATLTDIEKNVNKRTFILNGRKVALI